MRKASVCARTSMSRSKETLSLIQRTAHANSVALPSTASVSRESMSVSATPL